MAPLLDLSGTLIHRYALLGPVALHEPHELAVGLRLKDWQDEVKRLSDIDTIGVIIAFAVGGYAERVDSNNHIRVRVQDWPT